MSRYQRLFDALSEAEEIQSCLGAVEDLLDTGAPLDASGNGGRDRLATLLGRLRREQEAALLAVRTSLQDIACK